MSRPARKRTVVTAIVLLAGLAVFVLRAGIGFTNSHSDVGTIRMEVDHTVLPLITADGTEPAVVAPEQAAEATPKADVPPLVEESKAEAPKEQTAAKPEPAPEAKPSTTSPAVGAIKGIALDSTDLTFTVTVTCNRPVGDTTYMNLKNPRRLVIDLREPWVLQAKNVIRSASGSVKHIVVGKHPDRMRLVVHFRTPPKGRLAPKFVRKGNTLIVTSSLP